MTLESVEKLFPESVEKLFRKRRAEITAEMCKKCVEHVEHVELSILENTQNN